MPVNDQWKLRDNKASTPAVVTSSKSVVSSGGGVSVQAVGPRVAGTAVGRASGDSVTVVGDSGPAGGATVDTNGQDGGQHATAQSPGGPRTTKNLAGFWSAQSDDVKVRKKRLVAVEGTGSADVVLAVSDDKIGTPATSPTTLVPVTPAAGSPIVVENVTQRQAEGVARAEDPGEWQKPIPIEPGRIKNVASTFQQPKPEPEKALGENVRRPPSKISDRWSIQSNDSARSPTSTTPLTSPEEVLNRKSDAIVLAENQPIELGADVVKSEGSSWDDVADLEAGRTKNLLARWKATEQESAVPKTSTSRYQTGSKPAWILEIEAAKETTSGAIGSSWTGVGAPTSGSDDNIHSSSIENTSSSLDTTVVKSDSKSEIPTRIDIHETPASEIPEPTDKPEAEAEAVVSLTDSGRRSPHALESSSPLSSTTFTSQDVPPPNDIRNLLTVSTTDASAAASDTSRETTPLFVDALQNISPTSGNDDFVSSADDSVLLAVDDRRHVVEPLQRELVDDDLYDAQTEIRTENVSDFLIESVEQPAANVTDLGPRLVPTDDGVQNSTCLQSRPIIDSSENVTFREPFAGYDASFTEKAGDNGSDDFAASVLHAVTSLHCEATQEKPHQETSTYAVTVSEPVPHPTSLTEEYTPETASGDSENQQKLIDSTGQGPLVVSDVACEHVEQQHHPQAFAASNETGSGQSHIGAAEPANASDDRPQARLEERNPETDSKQRRAGKKTKDKDDKRKAAGTDAEKRWCLVM